MPFVPKDLIPPWDPFVLEVQFPLIMKPLEVLITPLPLLRQSCFPSLKRPSPLGHAFLLETFVAPTHFIFLLQIILSSAPEQDEGELPP